MSMYTYMLGESLWKTEDGYEIFCICNDGQFGHSGILGAGTDGFFYEGIPGFMTKTFSKKSFDPQQFFDEKWINGELNNQEYDEISEFLFNIYVQNI